MKIIVITISDEGKQICIQSAPGEGDTISPVVAEAPQFLEDQLQIIRVEFHLF
jgi:hypothetical protein